MQQATPIGALAFKASRLAHGEILLARAGDGSLYAVGPVAAGGPTAAWRQTPGGDRQWLAFDVKAQPAGTAACRRAASEIAKGGAVAILDWPLFDSKGLATERRTPVRVSRSAEGLLFEPLGDGEPLRIHASRIPLLLAGRMPVAQPGAEVHAGAVAARLLGALRDAPGLLSRGERLRAGAGIVSLSSGLRARDSERRLLERCLDRVCDALVPMLDLHKPNARFVEAARKELDLLAKAPARVLGPQGRAWALGEAGPAVAVLAARIAERAREIAEARDLTGAHDLGNDVVAVRAYA